MRRTSRRDLLCVGVLGFLGSKIYMTLRGVRDEASGGEEAKLGVTSGRPRGVLIHACVGSRDNQ